MMQGPWTEFASGRVGPSEKPDAKPEARIRNRKLGVPNELAFTGRGHCAHGRWNHDLFRLLVFWTEETDAARPHSRSHGVPVSGGGRIVRRRGVWRECADGS